MRTGICAAILAVMLATTGCGERSASDAPARRATGGQRVAVVDMDRIGQAMGWHENVQRTLSAREQELNIRLEGLQKRLEGNIKLQRERLGDSPSQDDQRLLAQSVAQANEQLRQATAQAQQDALRARVAVVGQYREMVRPVVRRLAQEIGAGIVLLPGESIFWVADEADLTDRVIEELRRNPPAPPSAATGSSSGDASAPPAANDAAAPSPAAP